MSYALGRCGQLASTSGRGSSATSARSTLLITHAFKRQNNQRPPQQGGFIDINTLPPLDPQEAARLRPPQQQPQQQNPAFDPIVDPQQAPAANPYPGTGYIDNFPRQGGYSNNPNRRNNIGGGGYQTFNDPYWGTPPSQNGGWNRFNRNNNRGSGFVGFDDQLLLEGLGDMDYGRGQAGLMDAWEEEVIVEEDTEPKYVNGRRVLCNSEIEARRVRVQNARKEEVGVMSYEDARNLAISEKADVVMVNEGGDPPVVRIIEFGKYKFEIERAAKQKQKSSKGVETKEVRLRPTTEPHDYEVKVKAAKGFLGKGSKVKLTMQFNGREMRFKEQGKELMLKLIEDLSSIAKMDAPLSLRPSTFSVTLSPLK